MSARVIDGKNTAAQLRKRIADAVGVLKQRHGCAPGLAVILVGEDPASQVYVRNKGQATKKAGMNSREYRMPETSTTEDVLKQVRALNDDSEIDGILVQLPLPGHIDSDKVIASVAPEKDVDGFHQHNVARLAAGKLENTLVPCTPMGCMILLREQLPNLTGAHAMIIGRSNIVGKPMASLLLQANCTVTIGHSRSRELHALCRQADILVAAVGKPELVTSAWVKPGAVILDVGINRVTKNGKSRLLGDVKFEDVKPVASAITPVPGGIGPMTIAVLLGNTLQAALSRRGIEPQNIDMSAAWHGAVF